MDEELKHREVDIPGGITLFLGNHQPSITAVLRAVKRAEHGILNCIASIVHDYEFVSDVATAFSPFPLLANLRCGLWYAANPTDTCYFKSTDGHSGEWSFSTARLNLHVAQIAAQHGGVCIVDATRRGKTFPDAFTKTIPIWATVLNRGLAKLRVAKSKTVTSAAFSETAANSSSLSIFSDKDLDLDLDLRLPHWISENERNQIEQRLDTWVEELLALGVDLTILESTLKKPLRCIWVSQEEEDWLDIPENEEFKSKYTLIVLISASIPNKRQRRRLIIDSSSSSCSSSSVSASSQGGSSSENEEEDKINTSSDNSGPYSTKHSIINRNNTYKANTSSKLIFKEPLDLMYDYIPGAGDDEESWAKGLTPRLMWDNIEDLLRSGAEDIGDVVKKLVKSKSMNERAQKRTGAGARAVGFGSSAIGNKTLNPNYTGAGDIRWKIKWIADCVGIGVSTNLPAEILKKEEEKNGQGGDRVVILNVGVTAVAASEILENEEKRDVEEINDRYLHIPIAGDKNLKRAVLYAVPAAVLFASKHLSSSFQENTDATIEKSKNKILVVAEPEATDIAASIVVAILIACFTLDNENIIKWSRPAEFYPGSTTQLIPCTAGGSDDFLASTKNSNTNEFTRRSVRQYLSIVSAYYPHVVLSKSLLKQIYNAFLSDSMVRPVEK